MRSEVPEEFEGIRKVTPEEIEIERAFLSGTPASIDQLSIEKWKEGKEKLKIFTNAEQGFEELSDKQKGFLIQHEVGHAIYESLPKKAKEKFEEAGIDIEDFSSGYSLWLKGVQRQPGKTYSNEMENVLKAKEFIEQLKK